MQNLTNHGLSVISEIAQRYNLSNDAVIHMLISVSNGGGTMAQFNCPELGGGGQWMQGGMTMVGDMFNNGLKNTVDNLCSELSSLLYSQGPAIFAPIKRQQQPRNGGQQQQSGGQQQQQGGNNMGLNSITIFGNQGNNWWGADLGIASSTGGQNNLRYAVFPQTCRLAIDINGLVTVYDTLDHQIGGVSQQQGGDASMSFTSQYGLIYVSQLPIVTIDGVPQQSQVPAPQPPAPAQQPPFQAKPDFQPDNNSHPFSAPAPINENVNEQDIFNKIERLATLKEKGIITVDEFSSKKTELLQRL